MAAPTRIASPSVLSGFGALRLAALPPIKLRVRTFSQPQSGSPIPPQQGDIRETPKDRSIPRRYFNPSQPLEVRQATPGRPPDKNKANLGKTLMVLQERLPSLLQSPLPQDILAPNISLHLFPSTHPHLPTVSGRVAYTAALWTSPIAWNRFPIVGDVKLEIISEKMVKQPVPFAPTRQGAIPEQLVVRWCSTERGGKAKSNSGSGMPARESDEGFTGLFIFQFDVEGRILSHTIEHVQAGGEWENGVGAKFVGLTDWLLKGIKGRGNEGSDTPLPAACQRTTRETER